MPDPLILTALFDAASFTRFESERQKYYPATLNRVPAHLTLFHKLPGEALQDIRAHLRTVTNTKQPIALDVIGMRFLGRGVAYNMVSPELTTLHYDLSNLWQGGLIAQDRQPFRPHVVIQNKVDCLIAKALYETMTATFVPFVAMVTGLQLWHYCGGPWKEAYIFEFAASLARETPI